LLTLRTRCNRSSRADWISRVGEGLLSAFFLWSAMLVLVRDLWCLGDDFILAVFLLLPLLSGGLLWSFVWYHRARGVPAGPFRLIVGNALVLLALVAWLPLSFEIYLRFFYDETDSVICTKLSNRWLERYFHQNSAGFPDSLEYAQQIEPGKHRITLVGDSVASGYGVKRLEDRLVGRLRQSHPEWEVHLLARPGADTGQHLEFLTDYFQGGFDTHEVLLVYYLNDVTDIPGNWNQALLMRVPRADRAWRWLTENSYSANTLYYRVRISREPTLKYENYCSYVEKGHQGQAWEFQKKRLRALRDLVQGHGARLSVVTFPFVHAAGPKYPFGPLHAKLTKFWSDLKVEHLDLQHAFDNFLGAQLVVNRFDVHPNELAHKVAADAIARFLDGQISAHPASGILHERGD